MKLGSLILAALGALAAGAYYYENRRKFERETREVTPPRKPWSLSENGVDEELDESFPASDPPSWSSGGLH